VTAGAAGRRTRYGEREVPSDQSRGGSSSAIWSVTAFDTRRSSLRALGPLRRKVSAIFAALHKPVYRYVLGILGSEWEAEEVMQETFLALYREFHSGRKIDDPKPWVFRVAHNLAVDRKRRRTPGEPEPDDWWEQHEPAEDSGSALHERIHREEQRERVRRALRALAPRQRQCLELRAEGLTYRQIAVALGIGVSSVQNHLARGIQRIREELEK